MFLTQIILQGLFDNGFNLQLSVELLYILYACACYACYA